jgi:peptide chain release factor subunit 3
MRPLLHASLLALGLALPHADRLGAAPQRCGSGACLRGRTSPGAFVRMGLRGGSRRGSGLEEEQDNVVQQLSELSCSNISKANVNVVMVGHVDAGKSTISGHLLYLTGMLDDRTLEKFARESEALGRSSWKFAWAMDLTGEEREKGKTHEVGQAGFETASRRYTLLDAPGHKNFVPNMIGGATQAEVAILVISARKGEFEAGFERGGQTREHAVLVRSGGARHIVVTINKMDECDWDEARFEEIKTKLTVFLKALGFNPAV